MCMYVPLYLEIETIVFLAQVVSDRKLFSVIFHSETHIEILSILANRGIIFNWIGYPSSV